MSLSSEQLYTMMIAQLQEDGHFAAAAHLASDLLLPLPREQDAPRSLRRAVEAALGAHAEPGPGGAFPPGAFQPGAAPGGRALPATALDSAFLRFAERPFQSLQSLNFRNVFQAKHKRRATVVRFSPDGNLLVSGGCDSILKLINVEDAKVSQQPERGRGQEHGVESTHTRTLYGHFGPITDVAFHPYASLLASSSQDCTIKFFPTIRSGGQASVVESIPTAAEVTSVDWHACGVILAAVTNAEHGVRLIDINKPGQTTVRLTLDERFPVAPPPQEAPAPAPGPGPFSPYYFKCRFVRDSSLLAAVSGPELTFYDARTGCRRPELVLPAPGGLLCSGMHLLRNGQEFVVSYKRVGQDGRGKTGSCLYDLRADLQKPLATYPDLNFSPSSMANDSVIIGIASTSTGTRPIGYLVNPSTTSDREAGSKYLYGYNNISQIDGRYSDHTYCLSVEINIHICDPSAEGRGPPRRV